MGEGLVVRLRAGAVSSTVCGRPWHTAPLNKLWVRGVGACPSLLPPGDAKNIFTLTVLTPRQYSEQSNAIGVALVY